NRLARVGARAAFDHLDEHDQPEDDRSPDDQGLGPGAAGLLVFVVHRPSFSAKTRTHKIGSFGPITMMALECGERRRPEMGRNSARVSRAARKRGDQARSAARSSAQSKADNSAAASPSIAMRLAPSA